MKMQTQGLRFRGKPCSVQHPSVFASAARLGRLSLLMSLALISAPPLTGQKMSKIDRDLAKSMLENVSSDVRDHYFDQRLGGLDWTKLVADAEENIAWAHRRITGALA